MTAEFDALQASIRSRASVSLRTLQPSAIIVGDRHRKEFGDLVALARSINERGGLIHPVAITPNFVLIAGERRLRAWQLPECKFNADPIPITIIDIDSIIAGERDENDSELRKPFTPSEAVAIAREMRPRIAEAAKERQRKHADTAPGRKGKKQSGQVATSDKKASTRTREVVAKAVGRGARSLAKAEAIVEAAEAAPDKFGKLVEAMDRTGRVDAPYKRLKNAVAAEAIRQEPPPLPMNGPYRTVSMDIPWASEDDDDKDHGARAYYPYPTMTALQVVSTLAVPGILHADASVWLWIPNHHLMHGHHLTIARAWDLRPVALLTWVKDKFGQGQRVRGATEHVIQMIRGDVACLGGETKSWFRGKGGIHSQKPIEFYQLVEKLTPAPRYCELFSRGQPRELWDLHGNEIGKVHAPNEVAGQ